MVHSVLWRCQCRLCKLIIQPVLARVVKSIGATSTEAPLLEEKEVEEARLQVQNTKEVKIGSAEENKRKELEKYLKIAKEVPIAQLPQKPVEEKPEPKPATKGEKEEEEKAETKIQVTIPQDIKERLEKLETDVDKIKNYVKASIDTIKATLVDLRAAIAEVSNPFNLLRKYSELMFSEEAKNIMQMGKQAKAISSIQTALEMQHAQTPPLNNMVKQPIESKKENERKTVPLDKLNKLIRWSYDAILKYGHDKLCKVIEHYTELGVIDREDASILLKIIETVEKLRKEGLDVKSQVATALVLSRIARNLKEDLNSMGEDNENKADVDELLEIVDSELQGDK